MKEKVFLSDNDGTLTTGRRKITGEMAKTMLEFADNFKFCLATGSDYKDMVEQMPDGMLMHPNVEFWCCMGNVLYKGGKEIYNSNHTIDLEKFKPILNEVLEICPIKYHVNYPRHFEVSKGCRINLTMLGRPEEGEPTREERQAYMDWDDVNRQRAWVIDYIKDKHPEYNITLGGQISVDIVPKGCDKTQVAMHYKDKDLYYFGDRIHSAGNDNSVAHEIVDLGGTIFSVKGPEDTMRIMQNLIQNKKDGTF